ncbi:MAG: MFS transporter [Rhodospirillales bacterium]|nr:MFS transporter [Rhodospirillales bacterium]
MTQRQVSQQSEISSWKKIFTGRLGIYTLVLNLAIALFGIDIFVISTIMPTIVADIGGAQFYSWTVMLYMVGSIIGSSSAGPVKELFGRRNGYVFSGLLFAIGNLGAFFAPDMVILLIWRLVQGLGGGLMISQSFGLVGDVFPSELRVRILSLISTTWGLATIIGPGFGGIFAEFTIWRAAFACVVPLGLVFVLMAWRFIPSSAGKGLTK